MPVLALGEGAAPAKMVASGVASLFRETGWSVLSLKASSLILLVFYSYVTIFVSVKIFTFCEASTLNLFFLKNKKGK